MAWFSHDLFDFFEDLQAHNDREWFQAHKAQYESVVKDACHAFIEALAPRLSPLSSQIDVSKRAMFRIYRDTRFSADKTPYKTNAALHFRHKGAEGVSSPGFYLHLAPEECLMGVGIYGPDSATLRKLRDRIVADREGFAALEHALRSSGFTWFGESLTRIPRGFDKDDPAAEALKRKHAIVSAPLTHDAAVSDDFLDRFVGLCASAAPLVADQCKTLGLPW